MPESHGPSSFSFSVKLSVSRREICHARLYPAIKRLASTSSSGRGKPGITTPLSPSRDSPNPPMEEQFPPLDFANPPRQEPLPSLDFANPPRQKPLPSPDFTNPPSEKRFPARN